MRAGQIVASVHDGSFTTRDVADVHLAQIERYDDSIQAFATVDEDMVRAEADWLDRQRDAGARLPLHGVPVAVKDIIDVAGLPTIAGFEPYRENIARQDAAIISRLRSLGAFVLGKTHTTQFAVGDPAPTQNPWNQYKSPAGSSAGSGAAIPSGMSPIALGSQTAGSMLRPAAFNGCVGFKPTRDWMSMNGVIPLSWSLDHLGIYAGNVSDVERVYRQLAGHELEDSDQPALSPPRIALLNEFLEMSDNPVRAHLRDIADRLADAGATVVETDLPVPFEKLFSVHQLIFSAEMAAVHRENLRAYPDHYGPRIRSGVEAGALIPAAALLHAQRLRRAHIDTIDTWFSQFDIVMMPTVSTEACDRAETGDRRFQIPATLLGLPAISLPTGLSPNGLPLGTQLIGKANRDVGLLRAARWINEIAPLIGIPERFK
ncbi:MAG: amidase [Thermomicrobiaceae bacterium]